MFQVCWERSISKPSFVNHSSRSKAKKLVSKSTPRLHYITSKSLITLSVCRCISVMFQVSWGRFNSSSLLSVPREAFKNVKGLVQIHATSELHKNKTLLLGLFGFVFHGILVVFQVWERLNSSFLLSKLSEAFENVKGRVQIHATFERHYNKIFAAWFVCLCILVVFRVSPFLSEPCKWLKNEKARLWIKTMSTTMIEIPHLICLKATWRTL